MCDSHGYDTDHYLKMGAIRTCHRFVVLSHATPHAGRVVQSKFQYSSNTDCERRLVQYGRAATSHHLLEHLS